MDPSIGPRLSQLCTKKTRDTCSHIFLVHSGITEIISVRIAENLIASGLCNKEEIFFLPSRNHSLSLAEGYRNLSFLVAGVDKWDKYQPHRGILEEAYGSYNLAKQFANHFPSSKYFAYLPHTKLQIARSLVQLSACQGYFIIEEGAWAHCSLDFFSFACAYEKNLIPSRRRRLKPAVSQLLSFIRFWLVHPFNHNDFILSYVLGDYSCPAGWCFYLRYKFLGFCCLFNTSFENYRNTKVRFDLTSSVEILLAKKIRLHYSELKDAPIILFKQKASEAELINYIMSVLEASSTCHKRVIFRPHPNYNRLSLSECLLSSSSLLQLVYPQSEKLRNYPVELLIDALHASVYSPTSGSSVFLYLNLYSDPPRVTKNHNSKKVLMSSN